MIIIIIIKLGMKLIFILTLLLNMSYKNIYFKYTCTYLYLDGKFKVDLVCVSHLKIVNRVHCQLYTLYVYR